MGTLKNILCYLGWHDLEAEFVESERVRLRCRRLTGAIDVEEAVHYRVGRTCTRCKHLEIVDHWFGPVIE